MILLKIAMVGVAIAAMMAVARDQRWPQRAGVVGVCMATPAPTPKSDGTWYACKEGILSGFPNLAADTCTTSGIVSRHEIWHCDAPLVSVPGA
jgi:hypothetical protein